MTLLSVPFQIVGTSTSRLRAMAIVGMALISCGPPFGSPTAGGHWTGTWKSSSGPQGNMSFDVIVNGMTTSGQSVWSPAGMSTNTGSGQPLTGNLGPSTGQWMGMTSSPNGEATFNLSVNGPAADGTYMSSGDNGTLSLLRDGVGNEPSSGIPTPANDSNNGGGGGGDCADSGASCMANGQVVKFKMECAQTPDSQGPCYCASAATYECFFQNGCYEGKAASQTSVTSDSLISGCKSSVMSATSLGYSCGLSCG